MCEHCGTLYREFRTGLTYRDVYAMLWVGSDDPATWKYKRRSTILGFWHQWKKSLWEEHQEWCRKQAEYEAEQEALADEVPF